MTDDMDAMRRSVDAAVPKEVQDEMARNAAIQFMEHVGIRPTPDAVDQLLEVFVPCLRIMCDRKSHPWSTDGATWRESGLFGALTDARKKFARYWERTWKRGVRHDDSGYDCINFIGFSLRADPQSRWNEWGDPGFPEDM